MFAKSIKKIAFQQKLCRHLSTNFRERQSACKPSFRQALRQETKCSLNPHRVCAKKKRKTISGSFQLSNRLQIR